LVRGTQGCFVTEDTAFLNKAKRQTAQRLAKEIVLAAKDISLEPEMLLNLIKEEFDK